MRILTEQDIIGLKKQGKRFKVKKLPKPVKKEVVEAKPKKIKKIDTVAEAAKSITEAIKESNANAAKTATMLGEMMARMAEKKEEVKEEKKVSYKCTVQRDRKGLIDQIDIIGV